MTQRLYHWPLRAAAWDRVTASPFMAGVSVRGLGEDKDLPYVTVSGIFFSEDSTDTGAGGLYVMQWDVWGEVDGGAEKVIPEYMDALVAAITDDGTTLDMDDATAAYMGLEPSALLEEQDPVSGAYLLHGVVRAKYAIYQQ
jgi:hypothetical protein